MRVLVILADCGKGDHRFSKILVDPEAGTLYGAAGYLAYNVDTQMLYPIGSLSDSSMDAKRGVKAAFEAYYGGADEPTEHPELLDQLVSLGLVD
jgi:hypothetical protein